MKRNLDVLWRKIQSKVSMAYVQLSLGEKTVEKLNKMYFSFSWFCCFVPSLCFTPSGNRNVKQKILACYRIGACTNTHMKCYLTMRSLIVLASRGTSVYSSRLAEWFRSFSCKTFIRAEGSIKAPSINSFRISFPLNVKVLTFLKWKIKQKFEF